jgi:hypothetical protein
MYSVEDVLKGLREPGLILQEINKQYHRTRNSLAGINFVEEEWDNLIILDACRYDLFESVSGLPGELHKKQSNASATEEFLLKNFDGESYGDIVYYSANPHLNNIDAKFHDIVRLWETDWDDETGTVLPKNTAGRVLDDLKKYQDKRLIVHFIQPHRPFLGDCAEELEQSALVGDGVIRDKPESEFWWTKLKEGTVDQDTIWEAYRETLDLTIPHVERLMDAFSGRTVVTSDHGNAFGENDVFGHPSNTHHKYLQSIPWLVYESGSKDIRSGAATAHTVPSDNVSAEENLRALGYVDT